MSVDTLINFFTNLNDRMQRYLAENIFWWSTWLQNILTEKFQFSKRNMRTTGLNGLLEQMKRSMT